MRNRAQHIGAQPKPPLNITTDISVLHDTKQVRLQFNHKIDNLNAPAQGAVAIATALLEGAKLLDPATVEGITWK